MKLFGFSFHKLFPQTHSHILHNHWHSVYVVLLLIFGLVVALYLYMLQTHSVPAQGGEYREGVVGSPFFTNPIFASPSDIDGTLTRLMYSSLFVRDENGAFVPDLVQTITTSDDNTQHTLTIKRGVLWSDNTPLTTKDVYFTIQLIKNSEGQSPFFQYWHNTAVALDSDYIITINTPTASSLLGHATFPILPHHIWEGQPRHALFTSSLHREPVGSGQYAFSSLTKNRNNAVASYTLKRNPLYYGKKPYIENITFKFYTSPESMLRAYNDRAIDGMVLAPPQHSDIQYSDSSTLYTFAPPYYVSVFWNHGQAGVLQDNAVRQALASVIDKQHIVDTALQGYGTPMHSPIPPSLARDSNVGSAPVSPTTAQKMLIDAGWRLNNEGILTRNNEPLEITLTVPDVPRFAFIANILHNQWKEIGFAVHLNIADPSVIHNTLIPTRSYEALLYGVSHHFNHDLYSFWHSSQTSYPGLNLAQIHIPTVDTLLEQMRREQTADKHTDARQALQRYFQENALALFLYEPHYIYATHKNIRNVHVPSVAHPSQRFHTIHQWYINTKRKLK